MFEESEEWKVITYMKGKFYVDGEETKLWVVGGNGSLYKAGNICIIDGIALKKLVLLWIEQAMSGAISGNREG
jgi:hypothetical protein